MSYELLATIYLLYLAKTYETAANVPERKKRNTSLKMICQNYLQMTLKLFTNYIQMNYLQHNLQINSYTNYIHIIYTNQFYC